MTVGLDKYGETRRKPGGDAEAASQGFTLSEGPGLECPVPRCGSRRRRQIRRREGTGVHQRT